MLTTSQRIEALKANGEDHEWYPTTPEIIRKVARDIQRVRAANYRYRDALSILDIGAGDGRVLMGIKGELYHEDWQSRTDVTDMFAIEKAATHLANMPKEIVVIGTEFHEQTLCDKTATVVFCNPPYSEYDAWAYRILRECSAEYIYLVIPKRWRDSKRLADVMEAREAKTHSLGEFDFETADRRARAQVEVVRVDIPGGDGTSAFDAILEEMLPELEHFDRAIPKEQPEPEFKPEMVEGGDGIIETMVKAYDAELAELVDTYRAVVKIKPSILKELGVTKKTILDGLRDKTSNLKNKYWEALFDHLADIKRRLATKQRKEFLESLNGKAVIDFTESNILSMLIWIAKWAGDHFDQQLIDLFKALTQKATIARYKSNQKVWRDGDWRYLKEEATHYKLEYRLVLEGWCGGGINTSAYSWEAVNGLAKGSAELLRDFVTVANNLGFDCDDGPEHHRWVSNRKVEFRLRDGSLLMDVRAFKNGNMHIRVAKDVMLAINVQAGKLLGWLHSWQEAVKELDAEADTEVVREKFAISHRIEPRALLTFKHEGVKA